MRKKTEYDRYLKIADKYGYKRTFEVNKTFLCDIAKANACQARAKWYGFETIGPRAYALYQCSKHGIFRFRI